MHLLKYTIDYLITVGTLLKLLVKFPLFKCVPIPSYMRGRKKETKVVGKSTTQHLNLQPTYIAGPFVCTKLITNTARTHIASNNVCAIIRT